ncbi:ATP-binding protein [Wohlfahrtiimonas chitiniclastica]|uniref:AAA family ATPase n=1 Tax=Wohlfahrtiimonas chitiniclastica TaxID=400946 RepID=UPI0007B406A5|nr:ATP-binding protein [Wohlfahrtiimonas chitiniclastica]KZS22364.1 RloA protein [Wohlfahrtiimonas chitiniclastica]MBS7814035.1 ATP-binding protein [Wohlfahrtiimonas chitiniclastica]MBS7817931.1 ATP-binding protein [Wohlfahrtiimonas chitiniclastica]MBS7825898.1 ATP-binding protein [Wohlfahrtiimonas chitiniclastica]MDC7251515.1 abortive infection protein [Wohlfahrtiimonas chitiniclastica]
MLVEFSVENFRSIKNEQTLSLLTTKSTECPNNHFVFDNGKEQFDLLKSVIIYGANGSGKSNLIKSFRALQCLVLGNDLSILMPFKLDANSQFAPTTFDLTFIVNQVRYQYVISATSKKIYSECLYQFPKGRVQVLFERYLHEETKEYAWNIGNALKGQKMMWKDATRYDQLFLKKASDNNSEQLMQLTEFFEKRLQLIDHMNSELDPHHSIQYLLKEEDNIAQYLKKADLGIDGVKAVEKPFSFQDFPKNMPEPMKKELFNKLKDKNMLSIFTVHQSESLGGVEFELSEESTGTQKYFGLAGYWINALKTGSVLVVDELQNNLHPKLVQYLTGLFNHPDTNPHNAQLIFTSHDISLLSSPFEFRRDQIVFCDKNRAQETEVFSLVDFHVRKDKQDIAKDYLNGRFGGIPFIRD